METGINEMVLESKLNLPTEYHGLITYENPRWKNE